MIWRPFWIFLQYAFSHMYNKSIIWTMIFFSYEIIMLLPQSYFELDFNARNFDQLLRNWIFVAFWEKNVRFPQRGFGREKSKGGNWVFRLLGIFWMWSQPESATGRSKSFAPKIKSVRFIHWDHRRWKRGNILSANTSFNLRNEQSLFHQFWTGIGYAVLSFVTTWGHTF